VSVLAVIVLVLTVFGVNQVDAASTINVTFSQSGGTSSTYSRDPSFSLEKSAGWITISTSSPSNFTIKASSNTTGKGRIGYVYVKRQGSVVTTYKIVQSGSTNLSVGIAKGSTSTYGKNSNQSISVSGSWITIYRPNDYNFRIDYSANTTGSTRTGYVYVKEDSTTFTTYKITQSSSVTVTYDKNGGGSSFTRTISYGSTYGKVDNPTRTGYNFAGWYTAKSGGTQVTETTKMTSTANHTLYAHWTAKSYTVSFNSQGGTSVSSKTVYYDGTYGSLTNPTKTGYTFAGWYTAASGGSQVISSTKVTLTANQVLYAHWTANSYTVSFNSQGGSSVSSKTVTYGSKYGTLSSPTKTGYTFAGWYTAASGGSQVSSSTTVSTASNHTVYAHWTANKYTVTYDKNGGSGDNYSRSIAYGSIYGKTDNPTRTGYTFTGWYTAKSGGSQVTESTLMSTANNHTLYARWVAKTYTITFISNGGTTVSSKVVTYDSTYGSLSSPTKTGYTFAGWFTATSGGSKITSSTKVTITANQTLYAHWTANNITVTYDKNGGSGSNLTRSIAYGSNYGKVDDPTRTGYTFKGWYTAKTGGSQITETTKMTSTTNHTLYARWTAKTFTISFSSQGGGAVSAKTVTYDSTYGALVTPNNAGYDFAGWYTAASGGTQVKADTKVAITANQTLYAHWTPKKLTISFDSQGGSSVSAKSVTFGDTYGTLPTPTRANYTFNGWYTAAWGGTKIADTTKVTVTTNQTLYALWTGKKVTVTYDLNGGDGDNLIRSIEYGKPYGKVGDPTRTGYEFHGWYTSKTYETQVVETTIMSTAKNHTLYAKWTPKTYTVTFKNGDTIVSTKKVAYDSTYGTMPLVTKTGHDLVGWYTAASGGSKVTTSTKVKLTADQTLYARWTPKTITISFDSQGGSVVDNITVIYGNTYGELPVPEFDGYIFDGWFTEKNGGDRVTEYTKVKCSDWQTLYAKWTAKSKITFKLHTDPILEKYAPYTRIIGDTFGTLPPKPSISPEGYIFDGWYTEKEGGKKLTPDTIVTSSMKDMYVHWKPRDWTPDNWSPAPIKVLIIKFDPLMVSESGEPLITKKGKAIRLHDLMETMDLERKTYLGKWHDPDQLAEDFAKAMKEVSSGYVEYDIVDSVTLEELPMSTQNRPGKTEKETKNNPPMQYSISEYFEAFKQACGNDGNYPAYGGWIDTGFSFDYDKYFTQLNVYDRVNRGEIDEVWIFAGPCAGTTLCESMMTGKDAFYLNGSPLVKAGQRNFVTYGFSYERDIDCMLEDAGHRMEWTMSRVYSGVSRSDWVNPGFDIKKDNYIKSYDRKYGKTTYKDYSELNAWEKFWAHDLVTDGKITAGVGSVHCGPNARGQYDWNNNGGYFEKKERDTPIKVESYCDDWFDYPYLAENAREIGSDEWEGNIIGHHKWWLKHIPRAGGTTYGKYNNWWKYFLFEDLK
jgi:uncharacterized repeat protein (TIGR02543 family)